MTAPVSSGSPVSPENGGGSSLLRYVGRLGGTTPWSCPVSSERTGRFGPCTVTPGPPLDLEGGDGSSLLLRGKGEPTMISGSPLGPEDKGAPVVQPPGEGTTSSQSSSVPYPFQIYSRSWSMVLWILQVQSYLLVSSVTLGPSRV